jgi:hypothetical protein
VPQVEPGPVVADDALEPEPHRALVEPALVGEVDALQVHPVQAAAVRPVAGRRLLVEQEPVAADVDRGLLEPPQRPRGLHRQMDGDGVAQVLPLRPVAHRPQVEREPVAADGGPAAVLLRVARERVPVAAGADLEPQLPPVHGVVAAQVRLRVHARAHRAPAMADATAGA